MPRLCFVWIVLFDCAAAADMPPLRRLLDRAEPDTPSTPLPVLIALALFAGVFLLIYIFHRLFIRLLRPEVEDAASDAPAGAPPPSDAAPPPADDAPPAAAAQPDAVPAAPLCVVCLSDGDSNDEVTWLPMCGHAFHSECILPCDRCPLCSSVVNPTARDIEMAILHNP
ncbi:hypothetical protein DM860_004515 [Cuscuta australis]|uniref:RING-type E3 ubiquitin transferase n=1 Tax=Cuscuta australis TaxID=267555 RepID=A0A328E7S1_9ASTE|nr:hypothetical protein DM860_004515 [Cuscuta australis]